MWASAEYGTENAVMGSSELGHRYKAESWGWGGGQPRILQKQRIHVDPSCLIEE